jgi:hypothetical protein
MTKFNNFLMGKYFVPTTLVLIAVIAFCLGRVSGLQDKKEPVRITTSPPNPSPKLGEESSEQTTLGEVKGATTAASGSVVASKNGTKYHYPWCAGAKQISAANLVTFNSTESARAAGYTPASNCKGLK